MKAAIRQNDPDFRMTKIGFGRAGRPKSMFAKISIPARHTLGALDRLMIWYWGTENETPPVVRLKHKAKAIEFAVIITGLLYEAYGRDWMIEKAEDAYRAVYGRPEKDGATTEH